MEYKKFGYSMVLMLGVGAVGLIVARDQACSSHATLQTCECWTTKDESALELGKISLFFTENPMVQPLPSTVYTARNNHIFFIPAADASSSDLRVIAETFKKNNNKWYTVSLSLETKPIKGIKVVVTYDPSKVAMDYSVFDILGMQKGVLFRLYNKSMINELQVKERALLRLTQLKPLSIVA